MPRKDENCNKRKVHTEFCENEHMGTYETTLNTCTMKLCTTFCKQARHAMYI
jgi:hypothetical protein